MKINTNTFEFWINITIAILVLLTLTIGFTIGYLYKVKDCEDKLLTGELEKINKLNKADFSCSCVSTKNGMVTFTFDETEVYSGNYWYDK